ncbi:LPS export ABC transporter periplasmic protein LptC [Bradyrhizobium sp. WD16]|uniref:LPS export ABC transporter periplasmic protein LptC n=1 Tax=Bradyrhizobium sp. WD16 TaxID=1521768 RepID=UPI0020A3EB4D|nr:LPS export ABC transporter periplasmic protein LptC [Bradyrhizobium sp. WD16]UTD26962.1 LPS export ABC transporter periplasmic protein LptC [Bradyrhizobium sp. WD16]
MDQQSYQAGMERRFARASRHSARVRFLRRAIPTVVGLAILLIVAASVFNPFRLLSKLPLSAGNLVVSGTKITMQSPHLTGFTPDQRPYDLRAKTATQDVTDPVHVELQDMSAKVQMEDKSTVTMDSKVGFFDTKTQLLDLKQDIFLQSSTGYEARLTQAQVDLAKGTVSSDEPVAVKLLNGTLNSNKLRIIDNGVLVVFGGGVSMTLFLDEGPKPAGDAGAAETAAAPPVVESVAEPRPRPAPARRKREP